MKEEDLPLYRPSKEEIRASLPLPFVCAQYGITLDSNDAAICPFHKDGQEARPSFHLFEGDDGVQRWSCFPCGVRAGDVFDLIQQKEGIDFGDALERAQDLFAALPIGYEAPRTLTQRRGSPDDWRAEVNAARALAAERDHHGLLAMLTGLAAPDDPAAARQWDTYLRDTWGWGVGEAGVYMPHWDADGSLTGCKIRRGNGERISLPGSRYESLYGSWLGVRQKDTLLTEGETDAAWAGFQAAEHRLDLNVVALPRGAQSGIEGTFINYLGQTRGRLYLALDPDGPGTEATRLWIDAFITAGFGDRIRLCTLPLGRDLRAAAPNLQRLLVRARRPTPEPDNIMWSPAGYVRNDRQGNMYAFTDWTIDPRAVLAGGAEPGYDVALEHRATVQDAVIRLSEMESRQALNRWAGRYGLTFTGTEVERVAFVKFTAYRASVVPEIFQTDRVGMHSPPEFYADHRPSVVYPSAYHGPIPWRYTPHTKGPADVSEQVLLPAPGAFDWRWLEAFLALNDPAVTHPLLAWLVASARRDEIARFPLLFIGGSSGVGKSTIAELGQRLVGSAIRQDLGSVTPFILLRTLSTTTTLPVFVDEWTRLSRRDTREAFQGAIPAIYTGATAERGQADLSAMAYPMTAPVIVAGEDTFNLDRAMERIVAIHPSRRAQNHAALAAIAKAPLERFGDLLHFWLAERAADLPPFTDDADSRVEYNRGVLLTGWATARELLKYAAAHGERPITLPAEPDLSALERTDALSRTENVYEQALEEGYPLTDSNGIPVVWTDVAGRGTWIRARALIGLLRARGIDVELPGGERAMLAYFEERHNLIRERVTPPLAPKPAQATLIEGLLLHPPEAPEPTWFNQEGQP